MYRILVLVALLAKCVENGFSLMRRVLDAKGDVDALRRIFDIELSGYWLDHSDFDVASTRLAKALSKKSVDLLLINLVAPLYYAYSGQS